MKETMKKLYRAAKRLVPVLTIVLLLGQIPVAYIELVHQVTEDSTMAQ
jgi:hypothetical protein